MDNINSYSAYKYDIIYTIKEEHNLPKKLPVSIPLNCILMYYNKYWNHELSEDEESNTS